MCCAFALINHTRLVEGDSQCAVKKRGRRNYLALSVLPSSINVILTDNQPKSKILRTFLMDIQLYVNEVLSSGAIVMAKGSTCFLSTITLFLNNLS